MTVLVLYKLFRTRCGAHGQDSHRSISPVQLLAQQSFEVCLDA